MATHAACKTYDDRERLRCLWTAYVLHHDLSVSSSEYEGDLRQLWNTVGDPADETEFKSFKKFMSLHIEKGEQS